jgi:hypothetical protein
MGNLIRWHQTEHRSGIPVAEVLRARVCAGQNDQAGCASPERFGRGWVSGEPALLPGPRVGRVRRRRRPCDRKSPCDRHSRSHGRGFFGHQRSGHGLAAGSAHRPHGVDAACRAWTGCGGCTVKRSQSLKQTRKSKKSDSHVKPFKSMEVGHRQDCWISQLHQGRW